jgi:two-component system, chemotaxis family, protein-glutamate methylesterase/glutaminase
MINTERITRDVIVIGGSAGSILPIMSVLAALPGDLPAVLGVVVHRSPFYETKLPTVLGRRSALRVIEPEDCTPLEEGVVHVAPRDRHLLFAQDVARVDRGPKQHRTRPAVDPLFLSAAESFGPRVVGVLLSGMGADGVQGFVAIKAAGGITLVQSPDDAQFPFMPLRALKEDDVNAALPIDAMAATLVALASGELVEAYGPRPVG